MATARFLGWLGAASAVAMAGALVAGNDEDASLRSATGPAPMPLPLPLPIVQAVVGAATPAVSTKGAPVPRPAASPARAAARPVPTPARVHEVEREVVQLREAGGSDDDAYRLRALALNPEFAAQQAEREAAERAWQHVQAQSSAEQPAPRPQIVSE